MRETWHPSSPSRLANVFELEFGDGGGGEEYKRIPLFRWIRKFVTIASTDTLYGPEKDPMRDAEVMNGLWEVDRGFAMLGLAVFPDILARKASRGRKRFFQGFLEYYTTGDGLATASRLIQARYEVNRRYHVPDEDIARFDLGVCTGLLVNTIPAIFWAVLRVFSDPDLLRELRQSLDDEMIAADLHKSIPTTTISISGAIKRCPLIESLVSEVLRIHSTNASARVLLEDIAITDPSGGGTTYLLKKDSFLTVPSALFHKNEALWGPSAGQFDPARFVNVNNHQKVRPSANRTFGSGSALCPGRHFAMNEIMSFLVIALLWFDIEPVDDGAWALPASTHHISTSILTPVEEVWVKVKPREGLQDVKWSFVW